MSTCEAFLKSFQQLKLKSVICYFSSGCYFSIKTVNMERGKKKKKKKDKQFMEI